MNFKVGDIVQFKNNVNLRYLVTRLSSLSGMPTWVGLSLEGGNNGGTVTGSWEFDNYKVIGHYPIEEVYEYMRNIEVEADGTKE